MKLKHKVIAGLVVVVAGMQFFQGDKSNPQTDPELDIISIHQPSQEITALLQNACYDCHSNQSEYPWYSYVSPVSWLITHDINEGRHHLNFSEWGNYKPEKRSHKLEECQEEVAEGKMPLDFYVALHSEAKLTSEERRMLADWFQSIR